MTWFLLILLSVLNAVLILFALWPKGSSDTFYKKISIALVLVAFILPGGVKFYFWAQQNQIAFTNEVESTPSQS